ncbi:MAG: AAA family ATPase [Planctomycetota bacterium]|jgi:hypothetical protein
MPFKKASADTSFKHLSMLVYGPTGIGKTTFGLKAPGPVAFLDFEGGLKGPMGASGVRPDVSAFGCKALTQDEAKRKMVEFERDFYRGLEKYETLVLDTADDLYELVFTSLWGDKGRMPMMYAKPNDKMRGYLSDALNASCNTIWLSKAKKVYEGESWNGNWTHSGFNNLSFNVHVSLRLLWKKYKEGKVMMGVVEKSRPRVGAVGMEFECDPFDPLGDFDDIPDDFLDFAHVAAACTGTDLEGWG